MLVEQMSHSECVGLLCQNHLARLACVNDGQPYIVPVQYAYAGSTIYSFSMPGQKIDWMRDNPRVCLEIDELAATGDWRSVVVHGLYQELPDDEDWHTERLHAWSLLQQHTGWWEPGGLKTTTLPVASKSQHLFYSIDVTDMSGRRGIAGHPHDHPR